MEGNGCPLSRPIAAWCNLIMIRYITLIFLMLMIPGALSANDKKAICSLRGGVASILTRYPDLLKEIVANDCHAFNDRMVEWKSRAARAYLLGESFAKFAKSDKVAREAIKEIRALYKLCPNPEGNFFTEQEFMCGEEGELRTKKKPYEARMKAAATKLLKRFVEKQGLKLVSMTVGSSEDPDSPADQGYYDYAPQTTATVEVTGAKYDFTVMAFSPAPMFSIDGPGDPFVEVDSNLKLKTYRHSGEASSLANCIDDGLKKNWEQECPDVDYPAYWVIDRHINKDIELWNAKIIKVLGLDTEGQQVH